MELPKPLRGKLEKLTKEKEFFECLERPLPRAFRINTLKAERKLVLDNFQKYSIGARKVPWFPDAFVTDSLDVGNTIEHFMGHIYIQELTSMIPVLVLEPKPDSAVLDACAAPGSKTTQLAALMGNTGLIIANDISYMRTKALKFNMEKCGVLNTLITNKDARFFDPGMEFDFVLLDAPCSSEGTIRKNPGAAQHWSEKKIFSHSNLQKQMIVRCFDLLRPGGRMVYSTCTFAPEENEEVVQYLLKKRGAKLEKIELKGFRFRAGIASWGKEEFGKEIQRACRIWPQDNDTGGFFLAKISK